MPVDDFRVHACDSGASCIRKVREETWRDEIPLPCAETLFEDLKFSHASASASIVARKAVDLKTRGVHVPGFILFTT